MSPGADEHGERSAPGRRRARVRARQDHCRHRADRGAAPRGACASRRTRSAPTTSTPATTRSPPAVPGRNLDPVLCGEDLDRAAVRCTAPPAPTSPSSRASWGCTTAAAHVVRLDRARRRAARRAGLLVVDAAAQGRSVAALVHGFAAFDRRVRLGGVILNRVGSARHEEILREALAELGVPVLGVLRRDDAVATPVPAPRPGAGRRTRGRRGDHRRTARRRSRQRRSTSTRCWRSPRSAGPLAVAAVVARPARPRRRPVGGLPAEGRPPTTRSRRAGDRRRGRAGVHLRRTPRPPSCLAAAGAEVVDRSTRCATRPCPQVRAALVIGGGFPEVYADGAVGQRAAARAGRRTRRQWRPVTAECAGLLCLARELDGHPMCGVLDARARMTGRLTLGYREAVAASDSVLGTAGTRVPGHEFHRTSVEPSHAPSRVQARLGSRLRARVATATAGGLRPRQRARVVPAPALGRAPTIADRFVAAATTAPDLAAVSA